MSGLGDRLAACMAGRVFGKPLNNAGHVPLEVAWDREVQHSRTSFIGPRFPLR